MALKKGTALGPYKIISILGTGGMGEVYRARDMRLEREVALKVLPERYYQDQSAMDRFMHESKVVAALSHPNIRVIFDIRTDKNKTYAVMELLEGETLAEHLERTKLKWQEVVKIAISIATGLEAAHNKNIIHRDIKPQNIFITENKDIKILDFGLAQSDPVVSSSQDDLQSTLTQDVVTEVHGGTVPYMSPEQIRQEPVDIRSDIFAFGCVLYEMLTGKRLFFRKTQAETIAAILKDDVPDPRKSGIEMPEGLYKIMKLCLKKNPLKRFKKVEDIIFLMKNVKKGKGGKPGDSHKASVAVLPFTDLSHDKENEYFADGLTEELISSLVKIKGLRVASRTSSVLYKSKKQDIRYIGEQLNVRTVVEGSVRKAGEKIRVYAQLINSEDGFHLWSDKFDREIQDVFAIQSEISENIANALSLVLTEEEKHDIAKPQTKSVEAYDYCLKGRDMFFRFQRKGFERALKLFNHACKLDPEYATAFAWSAHCYVFLYTWFDSAPENLENADIYSKKALKLDPELAPAHVARGMVLSIQKQYDEAEKEFEYAIKINPNLYEASYFYARMCFVDSKLEKAAQLAETAAKLRPEDYNAPVLLGMIYYDLKKEDEYKKAYRETYKKTCIHLRLFPEDTRALYIGASSLCRLGKLKMALEMTERALKSAPKEPMTLYGVACNFAMLNHPEKAMDCLNKALQYLQFGNIFKRWMLNDPDLDNIRDYPPFLDFLSRFPDD